MYRLYCYLRFGTIIMSKIDKAMTLCVNMQVYICVCIHLLMALLQHVVDM